MAPALSAHEIDRQLIRRGSGQIEQNRHRDGGSRHHRFVILGNARRAWPGESRLSFESKQQGMYARRNAEKN
ncbi:hypothetical protein [Burkholderia anthina]|uniref:hypothetical protein n=1 Tax=Burkholderia anthina TaxID=179879 RepID=UPI00158C94E8|nr:hypothetical protein [Burkholderia anthina]